MMIEKVVTNFSDVSLWAIALVTGYILISTFLLLTLIWKRNHAKTDTESTNQSIVSESIKKSDDTKQEAPAVENLGSVEYSLMSQKYVNANMQKKTQRFDKTRLINLMDELRHVDTIIEHLESPTICTVSKMTLQNRKFYRNGNRQTGILTIREGMQVSLDGKIYRIIKIDTQHEINQANIKLDLEKTTIGGYSLKGKGNRYARLRKSNS